MSAFDDLFLQIIQAYHRSLSKKLNNCLILVGGCSRSGKSLLSSTILKKLLEYNFKSIVIPLDAWLISLEKRKPDSTVLERYECNKIVQAITILLEGSSIYTPIYSPLLRKRVKEKSVKPFFLKEGIVIADGLISLALPELRNISILKIFVEVEETKRVQRIKDFYLNQKKLPWNEVEKIFQEREKEEVPLIKNTKKYADFIFKY